MQTLQITIPQWNITELNGYEPMTTFWQDFSIADKFGNTSIGRNSALSLTTRYGSGTREIGRKPFSTTSYGEKRTK